MRVDIKHIKQKFGPKISCHGKVSGMIAKRTTNLFHTSIISENLVKIGLVNLEISWLEVGPLKYKTNRKNTSKTYCPPGMLVGQAKLSNIYV